MNQSQQAQRALAWLGIAAGLATGAAVWLLEILVTLGMELRAPKPDDGDSRTGSALTSEAPEGDLNTVDYRG